MRGVDASDYTGGRTLSSRLRSGESFRPFEVLPAVDELVSAGRSLDAVDLLVLANAANAQPCLTVGWSVCATTHFERSKPPKVLQSGLAGCPILSQKQTVWWRWRLPG